MNRTIKFSLAMVALAATQAAIGQETKGKYAQVNGLKMYYEIHGSGKPLVLLHGAFGTVEGWATMLPALAKTRQVIIIEQQGHGRTGDINRPLSPAQMADDTAALLKQLNLKEVDVFGYSMGGTTALHLAVRHPGLVQRLAIIGSAAGSLQETWDPEVFKQFKAITPEIFNGTPMKDFYTKVAPDPSKFPVLVSKIIKMGDEKGLSANEVKSIKAQTLIMIGDRDSIKLEHILDMHQWIAGSQLAIFPAGDHFLPITRPTQVLEFLIPFLEGKAYPGIGGSE
jgi:pimeloyl-ACP methyl ester carboxylesterase